MIKSLKRYSIILFCVPWFSLAAMVGCAAKHNTTKTPAERARVAVADIASGLKSADKAVQDLYRQQVIAGDEARRVETFIRLGTVVNDQLNSCVDLLKSAVPGTAEAVTATACVSSVLSTFRAQEAQAVVGIKSPHAQATLNASLSLIDGAFSVLDRIILELQAVH